MKNRKFNKSVLFLLCMIVFLSGSVFYINYYLNGRDKGSTVIPGKTRAQESSFSMSVNVNTPSATTAPTTMYLQPTHTPAPTIPILSITAVPTDVLPTEAALPEAGHFENLLALISVGSLALIFSFLF